MNLNKTAIGIIAVGVCSTPLLHGQFLSEFEPNPAGQDPADQFVEIGGGTPSSSFDLWIVSIENDGFNGLVDRVSNVTGSFDSNGLASVSIPDLENPSNTLVLTDSFSGDTSTDIDPLDDGTLDTSAFGTILDAIGVSDSIDDDPALYGSLLGGTDVLFNGQFEPLLIFRDANTNEVFNTVTVDFGEATERLGVFNTSGLEVNSALFDKDPFASTFGAINPAIVPEPSTIAAFLGLFALGFVAVRRRKA